MAEKLQISLGAIDVSLGPEPDHKDRSLSACLQNIGVETIQSPGSIMALALRNDGLKTGAAAGTKNLGGLSGAFVSVSEDPLMNDDTEASPSFIDRLIALTSVCSIGLDMVAIPGTTSIEQLASVMADVTGYSMSSQEDWRCSSNSIQQSR